MDTRSETTVRIGTSGYHYDHWRSVFYPDEIPKSEWFDYYAEYFDTVEINNTFYQLPGASTFSQWHDRAPEGFCYVLKFSRYGSHMKKLKDPENTIENFLQRAKRLREFLGPILVQLPPNWHPNPDRLAQFLDYAPNEYRWAVEFRHPDWLCDEVFQVLESHNAALCIHDHIVNHPRWITADWTYLRFHGQAPSGNYDEETLSDSAAWIKGRLAEGIDVYAYFNNDIGGYAIDNARTLKRLVLAN